MGTHVQEGWGKAGVTRIAPAAPSHRRASACLVVRSSAGLIDVRIDRLDERRLEHLVFMRTMNRTRSWQQAAVDDILELSDIPIGHA